MQKSSNNITVFAGEAPQYFPPPGYFYKMAQAGVFVLADDLQFSKHTNVNRCIVKTAEGPRVLTVPVRSKGRFGQKINEVKIPGETDWRQKHWHTLAANYGRAAYFDKYADALAGFFLQPWTSLVELNFASIEWARRVLQIDCRCVRSQTLKTNARGSTRIIAWARALHANVYFCEVREQEHLELEKFTEAEVAVKSYEYAPPAYHQQYEGFAPNLSILDLILNEGEDSGRILRGR